MAGSVATAAQAAEAAGDIKQAACEHAEAILNYEEALALLPGQDVRAAAILLKAAKSHLRLKQSKESIECSRSALQKDSSVEAQRYLAYALVATGDFQAAREVLGDVASEPLQEAVMVEIEAAEEQLREGDRLLEANSIKEALAKFSDLEEGLLFDCPSLVERMGRCYLALGDLHRVLNVSASLLRSDPGDVAAQLLRAEARFQASRENIDSEAWDAEAEAALKITRQALSCDPEHKAAAQLRRRLKSHVDSVKQVRVAMRSGNYRHAEELLTAKLTQERCCSQRATGRFAARCLAERGRARLELDAFEDCICDCAEAVRLDNRLTIAYVTQAQAMQKLERWDDAVNVLEKLHDWNKDNDIFWKLEWAKFEVRRVRRPDYYEILRLERTSTAAQVKKAYLKMSAEFHPDKQRKKNPDLDPVEAESKFKLIAEAYEFLGDATKRDYYDKGYDAQGIRECLAVRKRFAGQAPCASCGEDESGKMGSDSKWYCLRCWDSYYRDRPDEDPAKTSKETENTTAGTSSASSSSASSYRQCSNEVCSWPDDEPIPTAEDVQNMGIAELRRVLSRMKVDARGCLTKDELRTFINEALEKLQSDQKESPELGFPPSAAEERRGYEDNELSSAPSEELLTPPTSAPSRCVPTTPPRVSSISASMLGAPEWSFSIPSRAAHCAIEAWIGFNGTWKGSGSDMGNEALERSQKAIAQEPVAFEPVD